jgi:ubiquinone/menaquinone biosynthesis C-methylase UbiE
MARTRAFDLYTSDYDDWFSRHPHEYALELKTLRQLIPEHADGMEIGIGSGMFAEPLGFRLGIDPSFNMAKHAQSRGLDVVMSIAEALPFKDNQFDCLLMITTICFVDDIDQSLSEARRVLKPGGSIIVGFVDKESPLGKAYQARQQQSRFYSEATFFSSAEVIDCLYKANLKPIETLQTLLPDTAGREIKEGYGEGSFVAIMAIKK